jgi:hypothetical protein
MSEPRHVVGVSGLRRDEEHQMQGHQNAEDRQLVLVERLRMYGWKPTEVIAMPDGDESVALLFSHAPSPEMLDWLAWYAAEKASSLRKRPKAQG